MIAKGLEITNFETVQWHPDDLIGGDPCLDLVNTAGGRTKARDVERLIDYASALRWSSVAGLLNDAEAAQLRHDLADGAAALDRLRRFREHLHAALLAIAERRELPAAAWSRVEADLREARTRASLVGGVGGFTWSIPVERAGPHTIRLRAALAADRLLTGDDLGRVRSCQRCSWLYVDRSRGRRRRWCSMAACGNRAKVQRHYERSQRA